jgi:hypothetical protein
MNVYKQKERKIKQYVLLTNQMETHCQINQTRLLLLPLPFVVAQLPVHLRAMALD